MKRYTLLEMVQEVGRAINSDEITTLDESIDAIDIKMVVLTTLEDLTNRREWAWRRNQLRIATPPLSGALKVVLDLPSDCDAVTEFSYRTDVYGSNQATFTPLTYLSPKDFLTLVNSRNLTDPTVDTIVTTPDARPIYVYNNKAPSYYTQFDYGAIVCDAYDKAVDPTGLSAGRTMVLATVSIDTTGAATNPAWVADIPTKFFQLWLQEARAVAANQLRQTPNARFEREARRTYLRLLALDEQVEAARVEPGVNYGRPHRY